MPDTAAAAAKAFDLTGRRVGWLTVLRERPREAGHRWARWQTLCQCGTERPFRVTELTGPHPVRSCGCELARFENITGERFGALEARDLLTVARQGAVWQCRCDCGRMHKARLKDLRSGNTRSCGCGSGRVERVAAAAELTPRQASMLAYLQRRQGAARAADMGPALGLAASVVAYNVARLVELSLMRKLRRSAGRPAGMVALTQAGRLLVARREAFQTAA